MLFTKRLETKIFMTRQNARESPQQREDLCAQSCITPEKSHNRPRKMPQNKKKRDAEPVPTSRFRLIAITRIWSLLSAHDDQPRCAPAQQPQPPCVQMRLRPAPTYYAASFHEPCARRMRARRSYWTGASYCAWKRSQPRLCCPTACWNYACRASCP